MLVNDLGQFVARTDYGALPADALHAAKLRLLDVAGSALAGVHLGTHKRLMPLCAGTGPAHVWGAGARAGVRDAALVNSFLAHSTYLEDGSRHTGGHPSSVVIPAAVAVGETLGSSGKALAAAIVVGYEVFLRLGRAVYPAIVNRGFQSTAVLGAVSAAAAASRLMGLDAQASKNALAIACSLGVGLKEALKSSGSQPLQVGRACEGGVMAALFAQQGAPGADSIVEQGFFKAFAGEAAMDLSDLGERYGIGETYLKVHGGCRGNHAPTDLMLELARRHAIAADQVERVALGVDSVTFAADIERPATGDQAQFSAAFCAASALRHGDAAIFRFSDRELSDAGMRALMARITVARDPALDAGYPGKRGATARIVLKDGRVHQGAIENARGEPESPFPESDIRDKYLKLSEPVLGAAANARLLERIMRLEEMPDIGPMAACLAGESSSTR